MINTEKLAGDLGYKKQAAGGLRQLDNDFSSDATSNVVGGIGVGQLCPSSSHRNMSGIKHFEGNL